MGLSLADFTCKQIGYSLTMWGISEQLVYLAMISPHTPGAYGELVLTTLTAWESNRRAGYRGNGTLALVRALDKYNASPEATASGGDLLARDVWARLLDYFSNEHRYSRLEFHVLSGLLSGDGWQILFDAEDSARSLVVNAIAFAEANAGLKKENADSIGVKLSIAMAHWIRPAAERETASLRSVAAALFGEPWCVLIYDARGGNESLADVLKATQPEFLPGRVRSGHHAGVPSLPLPDFTSPR